MFIESYIGIVIPFAGNFAPAGWMLCDGRQLYIGQNEVLYSLLGTTFGGDGINTFALPNLCGRVAIHAGQGETQYYVQGQVGGNKTAFINTNNLPAHTHQLRENIKAQPPCSGAAGTTDKPESNYPAVINGGTAQYSTAASDSISMGAANISTQSPAAPVIQGQQKLPIDTMSPFLAMNYIICVTGIYPTQS